MTKPEIDEGADGSTTGPSALTANVDLIALTGGAAGTLAAITILASWPWALLAASLALMVLGVVVL